MPGLSNFVLVFVLFVSGTEGPGYETAAKRYMVMHYTFGVFCYIPHSAQRTASFYLPMKIGIHHLCRPTGQQAPFLAYLWSNLLHPEHLPFLSLFFCSYIHPCHFLYAHEGNTNDISAHWQQFQISKDSPGMNLPAGNTRSSSRLTCLRFFVLVETKGGI